MNRPGVADSRLARARDFLQRGELIQAELLLRQVLSADPSCVDARLGIASLMARRDDIDAAVELLSVGGLADDAPPEVSFARAHLRLRGGDLAGAQRDLAHTLRRQPGHHVAGLMLGDTYEAAGDRTNALRARHAAIQAAQAAGRWLNRDTTEPALLDKVLRDAEWVRNERRDRLFASYDAVRRDAGAAAMARVDRALSGYLGEWDATPPDPRQRPKFFYFPDLPPGPYHDPMLVPWARTLQGAWTEIRDEALELLRLDRDFESFLGLAPGVKAPEYVGGEAENPSWDAFFFYRHGQRYDDNHRKCPTTSALLEPAELCHVGNQAPEVCFSLIRAQSTIMAHYGVTNTRLVFHLPLVVPEDCALNVIDAGEHAWKPGEPMLFDDTFQHEAWNRSRQPRLILLMDCWNPHLTPPEQRAVKLLVEEIDRLENEPLPELAAPSSAVPSL